MSSVMYSGVSNRTPMGSAIRNYSRNLSGAEAKLYELNDRITTGNRFKSMSENTGLGVRALEIRRSLARIDSQSTNADIAKGSMSAGWEVLGQVHDNCKSVLDKYRLAVNGTSGETDLDALKTELMEIQKEMLQNLNAQFNGKYSFGGSNTTEIPFRIVPNDPTDPTRQLEYWDVSTGAYVPVSGLTAGDAAVDDHLYIDIGLGMNFSGGSVNPNSVFDKAMVGVMATGYGTDGNIYDLLTDLINSIPDNMDNTLIDTFEAASDKVLNQITQIGANVDYLTYTIDRLGSEKLNLAERQQLIEKIDPEEELIYFKMQTYIYEASLAMGSNLLRPTLFEYLR